MFWKHAKRTETAQNAKEYQATTTDDDWQQNRQDGFARIDLMCARHANDLQHDIPHTRNQSPAKGNHG